MADPQAESKTNYYYSVDGKKTSESGQDCTATSLSLVSELGTEVAKGTINKSTVNITSGGTGAVVNKQTVSTSSNEGTAYYYLVVEYENEEDQTSTDTGEEKNSINVSFTVDGAVSVTPVKSA